MAFAGMDPLAALGNYGSDDSDDSEEEAPAPAPAAPAAAPAAAAPLAPAPLPDADSLLSDMPTWEPPAAEPAAPALDPKGTKYNAVPMPQTMVQQANAASSSREHGRAREAKMLRPSEGSGRDVPAAGSAVDKKRLLPPQLRRPNISTEDNAGMRVAQNAPGAKRPKPDA